MTRAQFDMLQIKAIVAANKWLPKNHRLTEAAMVLVKHNQTVEVETLFTKEIRRYHYHYLRPL